MLRDNNSLVAGPHEPGATVTVPAVSQPAGTDLSRLAGTTAREIVRGFEEYERRFSEITSRSAERFERGDWQGMQADAVERLNVYRRVVDGVVTALRRSLDGCLSDRELWTDVRRVHSEEIAGRPSSEIAETFYNSVTRRIFTTVGVDPGIEYVDFEFERLPTLAPAPAQSWSVGGRGVAGAVALALRDHAFAVPFGDLETDSRRVAERIEARWRAAGPPGSIEEIEFLQPTFYRRKGAYLIGRVRGGHRAMPLVLALLNHDGRISVDAVLLSEELVSILFSFTRSYFHAEISRPTDVVQFLRTLTPLKPVAELYTALGFNKHGKTEFYRALYRHLAHSDERFIEAPGTPGMVMLVFTLPSYPVVFKVIRDRFAQPKRTTRREVHDRYRLVFEHDRAGRLVDAQEFEHLAFHRDRFSDKLLQELLTACGASARLDGDHVVFAHVYTERRVRPLPLYLADVGEDAARRAILDYGQAIRDLAATNVFPGDLLFKNFGVTRHGRVVFYDYDELCLLEECSFREFPEPRTPEDELADEPWFAVGEHDIFPEEFERFLQLTGERRDLFLRSHGVTHRADFWQECQDRLAEREIPDVFPYPDHCRLQPTNPDLEPRDERSMTLGVQKPQ